MPIFIGLAQTYISTTPTRFERSFTMIDQTFLIAMSVVHALPGDGAFAWKSADTALRLRLKTA
jgi:hypothetical protein